MPGSSSTIRMRAPEVVMSIESSMRPMLGRYRNIRISRLKSPGPRGVLAHLGNHLVGDEGIGPPLLAEGGHRPVAGHELDIVAERPEASGDRLDQLGVVAAREIRPPDGALEQHVAHLGELRLAVEEDHMARRVPRAVV